MPATLFAIWKAILEEIDEHGLAGAHFTMEHEAFGALKLHGLFMARENACQGKRISSFFLGKEGRPYASSSEAVCMGIAGCRWSLLAIDCSAKCLESL